MILRGEFVSLAVRPLGVLLQVVLEGLLMTGTLPLMRCCCLDGDVVLGLGVLDRTEWVSADGLGSTAEVSDFTGDPMGDTLSILSKNKKPEMHLIITGYVRTLLSNSLH